LGGIVGDEQVKKGRKNVRFSIVPFKPLSDKELVYFKKIFVDFFKLFKCSLLNTNFRKSTENSETLQKQITK